MASKNVGSKTKAGRSARPERADFVGYVNVTLTEKDRTEYESWVSDSEIVSETYLDALDKGYQFTTKFNLEDDCYMCSISNWNSAAEDSGVIYTGRTSEPATCLLKALFVWDRKLARNLNNGNVKNVMRDAF